MRFICLALILLSLPAALNSLEPVPKLNIAGGLAELLLGKRLVSTKQSANITEERLVCM